MRKLPRNPRVAVLGATGAVGRMMLSILAERAFPASEVQAIATARSKGRVLPFGLSGSSGRTGTKTVTVRTVEDGGFEGLDLVLVDTPDEAATELIPRIVEAGAIAIDKSAAWRMNDSVPLVVPEINSKDLETHSGIISCPNCTTIGVVLPLAPLHERFGLKSVVMASYQSASGAGQAGVEELREQAVKLAGEVDALSAGRVDGMIPELKTFPAPVAFNVVPRIGPAKEDGYTGEEWKALHESRKILGLPGLQLTATCVRVPSFVGHGAAVHAQFEEEVDVDGALDALRGGAGVEVVDLPTALLSAGKDVALVGRVRRDPADSHALWFFCACDNLRKGAALNAAQIAELLLP